MKKTLLNVIFSVVFLAGIVSVSNAQTVSGSIGNGTIPRGGSARGTIVLSVPGGLHVNSNRPGNEYQIPTTVRLTAVGAKAGAVSYPRGKNRKFGFSDGAINVYDGSTAFNFNVTVPKTFKGNVVRVRAVVKYQACTDEVCYPPKSKEITLTARVK
jgi:Disulphide bond corrector protein DsbC